MKRLGYAPEAVSDLREIALFMASDDPERASSFVDELERKASSAARHPRTFRKREEIAPGLRSLIHGRYVIFFRELEDEVRIVRVLHGARDISGLFNDCLLSERFTIALRSKMRETTANGTRRERERDHDEEPIEPAELPVDYRRRRFCRASGLTGPGPLRRSRPAERRGGQTADRRRTSCP